MPGGYKWDQAEEFCPCPKCHRRVKLPKWKIRAHVKDAEIREHEPPKKKYKVSLSGVSLRQLRSAPSGTVVSGSVEAALSSEWSSHAVAAAQPSSHLTGVFHGPGQSPRLPLPRPSSSQPTTPTTPHLLAAIDADVPMDVDMMAPAASTPSIAQATPGRPVSPAVQSLQAHLELLRSPSVIPGRMGPMFNQSPVVFPSSPLRPISRAPSSALSVEHPSDIQQPAGRADFDLISETADRSDRLSEPSVLRALEEQLSEDDNEDQMMEIDMRWHEWTRTLGAASDEESDGYGVDDVPWDEYGGQEFDEDVSDDGVSQSAISIALSLEPAVFTHLPAIRPTVTNFKRSHASSAVRIFGLLVAFLRKAYRLPVRGCNLALRVFTVIMVGVGVLPKQDRLPLAERAPTTLTTLYKRFGIRDTFTIKALCKQCWRTFPVRNEDTTQDEDAPTGIAPLDCTGCGEALYDNSHGKDVPITKVPYSLLSEQLPQFLARAGVEEACEAYLDDVRSPAGEFQSIQDGSVWRDLKGPDGEPFFPRSRAAAQLQDELRLGIMLCLDWFQPHRTPNAPSYSSGPLSACIANLPVQMRYRVHNLLLLSVTPGPKEPNEAQLQNFMKHFVDDLLRLYTKGLKTPTPSRTQGRLTRVALIAAVLDHPALCKLCGFGDWAFKARFCTQCKAMLEQLYGGAAAWSSEYQPRDGERHKRQGFKYYNLAEASEREEFFAKHGVRFSQLFRLPYFDPVKMVVIDPMHCILQGDCRLLWYSQWILGGKQKNAIVLRKDTEAKQRELAQVHQSLDTFEMPTWYARLPREIGYPAGGNLTSDEWKGLMIAYGPLVLPEVLDGAAREAQEDYGKAVASLARRRNTYERELALWNSGRSRRKKEPVPPPEPVLRVHPEAARNYLCFATSIKILTSRSLTHQDLDRAKNLWEEFARGFVEIYGYENLTPSVHWTNHVIADEVPRFGAVHNFWTFIFERLCKVLKSTNTNNHGGGEIEVTFAREFERYASLRALVLDLVRQDTDSLAAEAAIILEAALYENRGTLADLAKEQNQVAADMKEKLALLGTPSSFRLSPSDVLRVLAYYQSSHPSAKICHPRAATIPVGGTLLTSKAESFRGVIYEGRRITTFDTAPSAGRATSTCRNSLVYIYLHGRRWVGELIGVFGHQQAGTDTTCTIFLRVRWLKPRSSPLVQRRYDDFPELEVDAWHVEQYLDPGPDHPSELILASELAGQAARATVMVDDELTWMTIGLRRHGPVM